jgi:cytochrome c biogenesis protein CcmG/thiol:disulfide interchange protein DsbE
VSRIERIGRALLVLAGVLVLADVVAVLGFGVGRGGSGSDATAAQLRLPVGVEVDRPLGDFTLLDAHGHRTSLASLRGRYVVVAPSLTLCHEVCPLTTGALMRLRDELEASGVADHVVVAEVSVDPWRDSPARLRAFAQRTGTDVRLYTGTARQLKRFWAALGVAYERTPQDQPPDRDWWTGRPLTFDVRHTDGVFVIDPHGRLRVAVSGMPAVGTLPRKLSSLLNDEGRENHRAPAGPWTVDGLRDDVLALMGRPASAAGAPKPPTRPEAAAALAGSPHPLAALHQQAGRLLDGGDAFTQRLAALRGRPVVINAWASWCPPCRLELPLFASAAARYGRQVAFVGLDVNDATADARRLLAQVPVSYPSYTDRDGSALARLSRSPGLPTTIFLGPGGKVVTSHPGGYRDLVSLEADIRRHALDDGA